MAGDWIKMRMDLQTHPKIVRIMSATSSDKFRVIGGLHAVWCVFDTHSVDGVLAGYSPEAMDSVVGWSGLCRAMIDSGWLQYDDANHLVMPEFDAHNGQSGKRRAEDQKRKRDSRKSPQPVRNLSAIEPDELLTREEKRREEETTPIATGKPVTADRIPYQDIMDLYNNVCGSLLPECIKMTNERKNQIRKLWGMDISGTKPFQSLEFWEGYFNDCLTNDHWIGKNDRGWRANFEFVTKEKNAMKVLEGN